MSQNKTVIQGLEPDSRSMGGSFGEGTQSFYTRGARQHRGTVVPGMEDINSHQPQVNQSQLSPAAQPQVRRVVNPGKPVVGFLYSISRTAAGEYWPLQIGRNSIGQNPDSDIVLAEGTVSGNHAIIVVRQTKNGVMAAITDTQSTNGTMINGDVIGFTAEVCNSGDVITIGNNYQLVLILVDAAQLGLVPSKDFIPVAVDAEDDDDINEVEGGDFPPPFGGTTRPGGFSPTGFNPGGTMGGFNAGGTVGLDGSMSGGAHGGTVGM